MRTLSWLAMILALRSGAIAAPPPGGAEEAARAAAAVAPELGVCLAAPNVATLPVPELDAATSAPDPYRIVIRWVVVRRSDGSGGIDESLFDYFMRDLAYGFRDTPFVFVAHPDVRYHDDDALYGNIPDFGSAIALMQQHAEPGVLVQIVSPTLIGGPPVTGLNFVANPRGNILAYHRIGQPDSIAFPPHEVGHVFFLLHPYETQFGAECTSGANCAAAGDRVCDTPASPAVHGGNTTATGHFFASIPGPCAGDPPYQPLTDLYMEAGWPAGHVLRNRFTAGETSRMVATLMQFHPDLIGDQRPEIVVDCDGNGLDDVQEILDGAAVDGNRNLVPDGCEILPRPGDLLVCGMTDDPRNRVRIFDRATGDFRETMWNGMTWAHNLRMGPDGLVYLVRLTIVQRLDLATGRTRDNFVDGVLEGSSVMADLLFADDGDLLVLDNGTSDIRRFDGATGAFVGIFADPGAIGMSSPKYMEYAPDGMICVVGNGALGDTIQRFDRRSGAPLGSLIEPGAGGLTAGQGLVFRGNELFVSNGGRNDVLRYDATTGAFLGAFVTAAGGLDNPQSLRFGPDGALYVASRGDDTVKRFDGATGAALGNFVAPGADGLDQPAGLLFVPRPIGDVDGDGTVGVADLLALLAAWGRCLGCAADLDGDGAVGFADLLDVLAHWTA